MYCTDTAAEEQPRTLYCTRSYRLVISYKDSRYCNLAVTNWISIPQPASSRSGTKIDSCFVIEIQESGSVSGSAFGSRPG